MGSGIENVKVEPLFISLSTLIVALNMLARTFARYKPAPTPLKFFAY